MAVQKSKKSRSKRDHRRSNNTRLTLPVLFKNKNSNEISLYHHITKNGFYKGNKII